MADVKITYANGDEVRWQLPDPDTHDDAGDVAAAITAILGDPDVHTMADRLPGWPHP